MSKSSGSYIISNKSRRWGCGIMIFLSVSSLLPTNINAKDNQPDWENPHVLGKNKLHYHVTLEMHYKERERN
ncbi:MAG: hypothetical protein K2J78_06375, partial [Muribaculaceae bacterium]|nr:hypothetical protein [Muribaculaceae bacterium]